MFKLFIHLLGHQGFIRYFKNTSWALFEQLLRLFSGLFIGIWVARYLGTEQFGILSYLLAFTAIFGVIAKLGLDDIVIKQLISQPASHDVFLGTAFWLKTTAAIVALFLLLLTSICVANDVQTTLYLLIIAAGFILQGFEVVEFYFHAKVQVKIISICKIIQLCLSAAVKIYLIFTQANLVWFVCISLIDVTSLAICYFAAYFYSGGASFYKYFDLKIAKSLIKQSYPLILSGMLVMIYMRIDQVMLKEMLGNEDVGIYSAAIRLGEVFYFIPMLVSASLFPAILNAKKIDETLYLKRLQRLYTFLVWIAILIASTMTLIAPWLINWLYGPEFQNSAPILVILSWAGIFAFLGVASSKWLISENLQQFALYRVGCGAIVNIGLNLVLIPQYGGVGAAIATLISQALAAYIFDVFNSKTRRAFFMKTKSFLFMGLK